MRVLFVTRPLVGHYYPMRPLMGALASAGDEVAVATGEPLASAAESDGVMVYRVGLPNDDPAVAHHRSILQTLPPDELRHFAFRDWFVRTELPPRARDLDAVIDRFDPDLIVHETAEFAAPLVATAHRIPYATHAYGPLLRRDAARSAGEAAEPFWRQRGLAPHPYAGLYQHLYLDICPPSLQTAEIADIDAVQPIGPPPDRAPGRPPPWLAALAGRPIVYVTLGTVFNKDHRVFSTMLGGLQQHAVNVVVTVGTNNDPADLGVQPPNIHVHRFIEQDQLLPHCSLAVVHGGAGTTFGALSWGVPLVVVPQSADQFFNAERVAAAGAGLALMAGEQTARRVSEAVQAVLDDDAFRIAARRIQHEFAVMPPPEAARGTLRDLARSSSRAEPTE